MKTNSLASLLCLAIAGFIRADDTVIKELHVPNATFGEHVLTNVRVVKQEPDGLRVSHDAGISKIPYEQLPAGLKEQFKFDPEAAAAFRAKAEGARRDAMAAAAEQKPAEPVAPAAEFQPITMLDVKNKWLAEQGNEQFRRAITAGEHDLRAQKYAHEYNAWRYSQRGDKEGADREQAAIVAIEQIEASNRLADATARNAEAVGQQQRKTRVEFIPNPYPVNQIVIVPTPVYTRKPQPQQEVITTQSGNNIPDNKFIVPTPVHTRKQQSQQEVITTPSGNNVPDNKLPTVVPKPAVVGTQPQVIGTKTPVVSQPVVQPQTVAKPGSQTTTRRKPGDPQNP